MNQSYYQLPIEKQDKLINAGYKVFALSQYKKASMAIIADEAGISKSLLFYYFKNKQEYYLFLFDNAVEFIFKQTTKDIYGEKHDLFLLVNQTIERRMATLRKYPYVYRFLAKAYYETLEDIKCEVEKRKEAMFQIGTEEMMKLIDCEKFKDPADLRVVINIITYAAEGCMRGREDLDITKMQKIIPLFEEMMESLKLHYYKQEYL